MFHLLSFRYFHCVEKKECLGIYMSEQLLSVLFKVNSSMHDSCLCPSHVEPVCFSLIHHLLEHRQYVEYILSDSTSIQEPHHVL